MSENMDKKVLNLDDLNEVAGGAGSNSYSGYCPKCDKHFLSNSQIAGIPCPFCGTPLVEGGIGPM